MCADNSARPPIELPPAETCTGRNFPAGPNDKMRRECSEFA